MAEEDVGQSRTEAPTPRRREEAREQGQVALSADLSSSVLLLVGVVILWLGGRTLADGLARGIHRDILALSRHWEIGPEKARELAMFQLRQTLELLGLFLGLLFVAAAGVGMLQAGIHFLPNLVEFKWERLSPANGWSRLFSMAAVVRGLAALLKVAAVAAVAYWVLHGRATEIATLGDGSLARATTVGWNLAIRLALAMAGALVLLGVADYAFQRWRLERSLRMTRQEMREELKREEGDPQLKARIRRLQRETARRRMLAEVPRAQVVITNPTHLAIALQYDRDTMAAPRVVAKGAGLVAQRIAETARRHAVPVIERKPLAQALFKTVEIDQEIPAPLYHAVAEVLAYVYRLRHPHPRVKRGA